jgi:hypothetical protein
MNWLKVLGEEGLVPGLLSSLCAADEVIRIAALRLVGHPAVHIFKFGLV